MYLILLIPAVIPIAALFLPGDAGRNFDNAIKYTSPGFYLYLFLIVIPGHFITAILTFFVMIRSEPKKPVEHSVQAQDSPVKTESLRKRYKP